MMYFNPTNKVIICHLALDHAWATVPLVYRVNKRNLVRIGTSKKI